MEVFDTIIGQNVKLLGNLTNQGPIQINGIVDGQVESGAVVIVGVGALVKGPVKAKVVEITGEVQGVIHASDRVEIFPKGKLVGDVTTKNLVVRLGAMFIGKSQQAPDIEPKDKEIVEDNEK